MRIKILSIFLLISVVLFSCLDEPDWHDNRIKKVDRHYKTKNISLTNTFISHDDRGSLLDIEKRAKEIKEGK